MDHRGNMSSQHRRSKINHSVIMGPELTQSQENLLKKGKELKDLTIEELNEWLEVCKLHEEHWKNRRSIRRSWRAAVERAEQELSKRG